MALRPERRYEAFGVQRDFKGGVNLAWRDKIAEDQVTNLVNMRILGDRLEKVPGYEPFASFNYGGAERDRYPVAIIPDRVADSTGVWVCMDGSGAAGGRLVFVSSDGVATDKGALPYGYRGYTGKAFGGTETAPDALLISNGNPATGILNVASGTPVSWKVGPPAALNSLEHWRDRAVGVTYLDNNLYFSPPRLNWATDANDWEFVPVLEVGIKNRFVVTLGQSLFVVKTRGIARVDYVGGQQILQVNEVTKDHGCQWSQGWCKVLGGSALAFLDNKQVKLFNGSSLTQITTERNVRDALEASTFDHASLSWDEDAKVLSLILTDDIVAGSWGYDFHFAYARDGHIPVTMRSYTRRLYCAQSVGFSGGYKARLLGVGGAFASGYSPSIQRETDTRTQIGAAYPGIVEFRPLDLAGARQGPHPHLRQVHLDISTAADTTLIVYTRTDGNEDWTLSQSLTLNAGAYHPLVLGVDQPGRYVQVKVDDGGSAAAWSLRAVTYHGVRRGLR